MNKTIFSHSNKGKGERHKWAKKWFLRAKIEIDLVGRGIGIMFVRNGIIFFSLQ